jgi:hypothetical protein
MEVKNIRISDLDLRLMEQAWDTPKVNKSVSGKPLRIGGRAFDFGIGTHAQSDLLLYLGKKAKRFRAFVGVDDGTDGKASVIFIVEADGKERWRSPVCHTGDAAVEVNIEVSGYNTLRLRATDAGDNNFHDHADWAEAVLEGCTKAPKVIDRLPGDEAYFLPGRRWLDTSGKPIQAHGGGILRHGGKWYWYGEDRSQGYVAIGVSCYVSTDLRRWKHLGVVLPQASYNEKHQEQTLCERPKVIYNTKTKQFVLWFHYDRSGYGDSQAGVAVAERPEGPFRFLGMHRPIAKATFRDMNLFVDTHGDGAAYVFYASEENATMHVVRLNETWTAPQEPMVENQAWARILVKQSREAPAPFWHAGKYWLITSGCTGWNPNPASVAVADTPLGPWRSYPNPCQGEGANRTFNTQSTAVIPAPSGKAGEFIFLADLWKPKDLADSRYVWLPFRLEAQVSASSEKEAVAIYWQDRWKL